MSFQRGYGEAEIGSDARPVNRGGMVTLSRGELWDITEGAKAKANRAFWRGSIFGVILATGAFIGSAAFGETITIGGIYINGQAQPGTTVSIEPSGNPGELAVVTMDNAHVNQGSDTGDYGLTMDGMAFGLTFLWDAEPVSGADRITVNPPAGITCLPADCSVTVLEGLTGQVVLLDYLGF